MDGLPWVHDVDDYLSAHEAATVRSSRTGSGAGDGAVAASVVALILLNGDIFPLGKLEALWKRASVHVCADGAANRLYDCFAVSTGAPSALEKPSMEQHEQARLEMERRRAEFVPSVIVGDLDSIRDEVRQFYADAGCDVQHVPDQDSHDFEKAVNVVKKRMDDLGARFKVAALGAFGGRLDQQFANINMLYRWYVQFCLLCRQCRGFWLGLLTCAESAHLVTVEGMECLTNSCFCPTPTSLSSCARATTSCA